MKLPWQKTETSAAESELTQQTPAEPEQQRKGYTPKKGRPTPKRDEVERAKGVRRSPVIPPETAKEARERRKALKSSMSKAEYKQLRDAERKKQAEERRRIQEAMNRGDEKYLLARDRGEERRFVRDWVDSRRHLSNWIMPVALGLLAVMFIAQNYPETSTLMSTFAMVVMVVFFVEGVIIGRGANRAARAKFPGSAEPGVALSFYAYSRATQLRRLRTPKPRVEIGAKV